MSPHSIIIEDGEQLSVPGSFLHSGMSVAFSPGRVALI